MNPKYAWIAVLGILGGLPSIGWADGFHPLDASDSPLGSVDDDFQISPDGRWVLYRSIHGDESTVEELFCVTTNGGVPVRLNGDLTAGGDVSDWQLSPDGSHVVYWADQDTDDLQEVYVVPVDGGTAQKLNAPLVDEGSKGGAFAGLSGDRVVYIGSQVTGPFSGPFYELFSVSSAGGESIRLNGPLVNGGDVRRVWVRPDGARVLYLADQDVDEREELFSVAPGAGSPVKLNAQLVDGGDVLADGLQFSPDGNSVLYAADQERDSVFELFSVPSLGGTPQKLNGPLANGGDVTPGSQQIQSRRFACALSCRSRCGRSV